MKIIIYSLVSISVYWISWNIYKKIKSALNISDDSNNFVKTLNFISFIIIAPIIFFILLHTIIN